MHNVMTIFKREIKSYFVSPVAYIVLTAFFLITGIFFNQIVAYSGQADLTGVLGNVAVFLLFLTPFITMKLLAEEKSSGTMELILTSPVTPLQVVLGKYFAAMAVVLIALGGTLIYVVLLLLQSPMEGGTLIMGYLGLLFLSSSFVAIGLTASAFSSTQISAGIVGFALSFGMMLANWVGGGGKDWIHRVLLEITPISHYAEFANGIFDLKHVIYFLLWTVFCLSLSTKSLEAKLLQ
jgi:ABC-2 type transport system permease protein